MTLMHRYEQLYEQANRYDQEHIFTFWEDLTLAQKEQLLSQAETIDFALVEKLFKQKGDNEPDTRDIRPPRMIEKQAIPGMVSKKGRQALREGKVAIFIVAGGQGSRLGFEGPKGCYVITPVKQKTIFQVLVEKVLAANKTYETNLDLYIMTSDTNHEETKSFFKQHDNFGLAAENILFFKQQMLPAVDENGRIVLSSKDEICMAPGGTGGIYQALMNAGIPKRMEEKGIDMLHYIQVDNPLTVLPDPAFVGQHLSEQAEMSNKIVEKTYPEEKVGVYVEQEGKIKLIEYIFMPEELLFKKDEEGNIAYRAGNIANHLINRTFIERVAKETNLPYFLAHKKINYINKEGERIIPLRSNAYKFESFVFDALPFAKHAAIVSVPREDEFAPVKNAEGNDSPDSAHNLMTAQAKKWMAAAGIDKELIQRLEAAEISPLLAATEEEFVAKMQSHAKTVEKQLKGKTKAYLS
jgi:UDP-N-acetylglucosamine/UDP-N-acetylgalactosamine diphosphorylase